MSTRSSLGRMKRNRAAGVLALLAEPLEQRTLLSVPYHLTFDEEFNSSPQLWNGLKGWNTTDAFGTHYYNDEQQYYEDPSSGYNPFGVTGGVLSITADLASNHPGVNAGGKPVVSGMLSSYSQFNQQYGYFEMRAQIPAGQGFWSAFWMLPTDKTWPPEYDIFEVLGDATSPNTPRDIYQTSHWSDANGNHAAQGYDYQNHINAADGMHTYGFAWDAANIRWYVDGVLTQTQTNRVNKPMYLLANLAVGGGWPGNYDASTPFPSSLKVDYIRAYSNDPNVGSVAPQSGYAESSTLAALNGVAVTNASFESGMAGWTTVLGTQGDKGASIATPAASNPLNTWPYFSSPLNGTATGTNMLYLSHATAYQDIGALQPNTVYTLTVALGVNAQEWVANPGLIQLINGTNQNGTVLASADGTAVAASLGNFANRFADLTVTYTTGATVSGDLTIAIAAPNGWYSGSGYIMWADNVRLTAAAATATASTVASDASSQGTWRGHYGTDGYNVIGDTSSYPAYATVTPSGQSSYTWAASTSDVRALQKGSNPSDRVAACWYSATTMDVTINVTGGTRRVALYFLDWDNTGRAQTVNVYDATTGAALAPQQTLSSFSAGKYLVYNITGNVRFRFTKTAGNNAVLSGLFFGAAVGVVNPSFESGNTVGWTSISPIAWRDDSAAGVATATNTSTWPYFSAPLRGTGDGSRVLHLSKAATYQDVGILQPNTTYTLTVAIGVTGQEFVANPGYIALLNGTNQNGTLLASVDGAAVAASLGNFANRFADLTLTYTTGAIVSGDLVIAIVAPKGWWAGSGYDMWADNVRLTASSSSTLRATADAYVRDGTYAGTNYGSDTTLIVKNDASPYQRWTYLTFDLSSFSGTIDSGLLRLSLASTMGSLDVSIAVYACSDTSWSETGVNWNNKPAATGSALATTTVAAGTAAGAWITWDLTTYLQQQKALGINLVTFVLKSTTAPNANGIVSFSSDEAVDPLVRPQLLLT